MKSKKTAGIIYCCCSIAFFISAAFSRNMRVFWMCLGTTFLCLGVLMSRSDKNDPDGKNSKDKDNKGAEE